MAPVRPMNYWREFLTIVIAHGLAVASPGPDFAMVLKQSLAYGRRVAVWTSCGIACGIAIHITYCLLGLGLILKNSVTALVVLKYLGAAYLAYLGLQALRSKPRTEETDPALREPVPSDSAAWRSGFLVNLLNPKGALFLISLFALVVSPTTPKIIQIGYGLWMTLGTFGWFTFVSLVLSRAAVRRNFLRFSHWIDRALGVVFLTFAVSLALVNLK